MNDAAIFEKFKQFMAQEANAKADSAPEEQQQVEFEGQILEDFGSAMEEYPILKRALETNPNPADERFRPFGFSPLFEQQFDKCKVEYKQELQYAARHRQLAGQLFQAWYWLMHNRPEAAKGFVIGAAKELLYDAKKMEQATTTRACKAAKIPEHIVATSRQHPDDPPQDIFPPEASADLARHLEHTALMEAGRNSGNNNNYRGQGNGRGRGYNRGYRGNGRGNYRGNCSNYCGGYNNYQENNYSNNNNNNNNNNNQSSQKQQQQ
ncbi:hypothetical protein H4R24_005039 [Coemansia sp. RSA 988]|nr:hypothetical protein H4R24_005039 [Coemansia sp. RSA 988]